MKNILLSLFQIVSVTSISQQYEINYQYDILPNLISAEIMSHSYDRRISSNYNLKDKRVFDSTNIQIYFLDTLGSISFKKFFNGTIYLEGSYKSSDSFQIEQIAVTDPFTDSIWKYDTIQVFYPSRCGIWKIYLEGKLQDEIAFPKCSCESR